MELNPGYKKADIIEKLIRERKVARDFQERKHGDWNLNYELSRNKVRTNRLTQRQEVNIPLMKETEKTLLSKIDDPPTVEWKEKGGDQSKEIVFQTIWDDQFKKQKFEWKDLMDKKNVLRYGLSTKELNVDEDKGITVTVTDVYDVVYDPMMDPMDVETARFIIRQNIYRSLREILADDRYEQKAKNELKLYLSSADAIIQQSQNKEEAQKKHERLRAMGVNDDEFDKFSAGDVIVSLIEHFTTRWNKSKKAWERRVMVYADDSVLLMDEPLKDLIGVDFWPFCVWYEDPETNDIYPDSVDDMIRVPNMILNSWYSQLTENRTLKNFQMHWYDATKQGYKAQTYQPGPGRMLPAPGNPRETIMPVEVSGLDDTLAAINYVTQMVERASGATAIEKGVGETGTQTLGEIQVLVGKASERTLAMQKFYRGSWYELANKWAALMHANAPKMMSLYKISRDGKLYPKTVYPGDWVSKYGYDAIVRSSSEQEQNDIKTVQKFQFVLQQFPNNISLRKVAQRRQLQLLDLSPEELSEISAEEEKNQKMAEAMAQQAQMGQQNPAQGQMQGQPQAGQPSPQQMQTIQAQLAEIGA